MPKKEVHVAVDRLDRKIVYAASELDYRLRTPYFSYIDKNRSAYYSLPAEVVNQKVPSDGNSSVLLFLPAVVLLLLLRGFVVELVRVDGTSMAPMLEPRSTLIVNRAAYGLMEPFSSRYLFQWSQPRTGDLVVFRSPVDSALAIKRVFAVPGDSVVATIGGVTLRDRTIVVDSDVFERLSELDRIPERSFFVLGENPATSIDSRRYGLIRFDNIRGRVFRF